MKKLLSSFKDLVTPHLNWFTFLFLIAFLLHAFFRLSLPYNSQFEYDQEMIANRAWSISHDGKLTLIGTKVGEFSIFTPPFYIYVTALFFKVFAFHPLANFYHAYFWSFLTFIALFLLTKEISSKRTALFTVFLYAISPALILADRIPWNVNPLMVFPLLGIYLTIKLLKEPNKTLYAILLGLVVGASLNSHFTGVFLILAVLWSTRKLPWQTIFTVMLCIFLWWIPIVIFDLRHDFLNTKGVLTLLLSGEGIFSSHFSLTANFMQQLRIPLENAGKILFYQTQPWLYTSAGLLLLFYFWHQDRLDLFRKVALSLITISIILFTLYTGDKPEYYYSILNPIFLIIWGYALSEWAVSLKRVIVVIIVALFLMKFNYKLIADTNRISLENKIAVLQHIKDIEHDKPVNIKLDMLPQLQFGFNYLSNYLNINQDQHSKTIYIIKFPVNTSTDSVSFTSGPLGVQYPSEVP